MKTLISDSYRDLLEGANTAVLSTLMRDGAPQGSPVWFWFDDDGILVSTTAQRLKHRNVTGDPRATLTIVDPLNPLRYIELRCSVELSEDPQGLIRDQIALKHGYQSGASFDPPGSSRVTLHLKPYNVIEH